jgi:hypothetical protein
LTGLEPCAEGFARREQQNTGIAGSRKFGAKSSKLPAFSRFRIKTGKGKNMATEKQWRGNGAEFASVITNGHPDGYRTAATVRLPATEDELRGAFESAMVTDGAGYGCELAYCKRDYLQPFMDNGDIRMLNELARKLSELDEFESEMFRGMVKIDAARNKNLSAERLLTLANGTDCCVTAGGDVRNDEGLGRFLFENDMLTDEDAVWLETKRNSPSAGICFAAVGHQHRTEMGGVFTRYGYIEFDGMVNDYITPQSEDGFAERDGQAQIDINMTM